MWIFLLQILKKRITEILYDQGYILKYKFEDDSKQGVIKIALKYDPQTKEPAIQFTGKSKPSGLAPVCKALLNFSRVKNGLGVAILSHIERSDDRQSRLKRRM